jgi:putative oxidoreductase
MSPTDLASFLLRFALGGMIVLHGLNKIKSKASLEGTGQWFASIGMLHSKKQALAAALTETMSGIFILLGFVTPLACAALISTMIVAIVVSHLASGFFIFNEGQGWEYCALISVTALALATMGPGKYSLDHASNLFNDGWLPVVLCSALAVGASAAHLAIFYRPQSKK